MQATENQPLPHELLLWRPFPTHLLPEPCAEYVRAVSSVLSCDEAFIAIPLLGVLGGAIGYRRAAVLRADYVQPATMWVGIIAPSGTIKTPAAKAAAKYLQQLQDKAYARYRGEKAEYEEQKELYDEWKRKRNRKIEDRPQVPDKPICQRYVVDDITMEKLAVVLQENPAGVVVCRDELAGWLTSFDQYKRSQGADENRWLEIWNGQWLTVDRKSNDEPIRIRRPSVSIVGTIQPRVFQRVVTQSRLENGLAQRVLWAKPPLSTQRWSKAGISAKLNMRMERLFSQLTGLEMDEGDHGPDPVLVDITGEAGDLWSAWYEDFDRRAHEQDELIRSAWTKLHVYAARFSLIIHVIKQVTGSSEDSIGLETVRTAIALAEWFAAEIRRVYTVMRADEEDAALIELAEAIHHRGGKVTVGESCPLGAADRQRRFCSGQKATHATGREGVGRLAAPPGRGSGRPTDASVRFAALLDTKPQETPRNRRFRIQRSRVKHAQRPVLGMRLWSWCYEQSRQVTGHSPRQRDPNDRRRRRPAVARAETRTNGENDPPPGQVQAADPEHLGRCALRASGYETSRILEKSMRFRIHGVRNRSWWSHSRDS